MPIVIETKVIKPAKLNLEAVRIELEKAVTFEGEAIRKEYEKTTRTWRNKPKFEVIPDVGKDKVEVLVGTDDKVFGYVDLGTRPHIIVPKRAGLLRFQSGYKAKTAPGVIGSSAGGKFGSVVYSRIVHHPGTVARNFSKIIQKRRQKPFQNAMIKAMQKGAAKANARG